MTKEKSKKTQRVSDFFGGHREGYLPVKIKDVLDKDVKIEGVEEREGDKGKYFIIFINDPVRKEKMSFACGGKVIMEKLTKLNEKQAFPILGRFLKVKEYYDII